VADDSFYGLVYVSFEMRSLIARLRVIAGTDEITLVLGESGTGKEPIARAVHGESRRRRHPFVAFNCSALSLELIESRLFGYRKGAFTGAYSDHQGVIGAAAGGSLFLDEIGDLTLEAQGALLRFLDDGEIQPVGASRPVNANVRVIAATNRDLAVEVEAARFRKDLYYRLNVATLVVPPLRSRADDVKELSHYFSRVYSHKYGKAEHGFTCEEMARLVAHDWPGNVRELESCIKRLILFGELDIQKSGSHPSQASRVWRSLTAPEKHGLVMECLEGNGWNLTLAAKHLGISRRTVQRVVRKEKQNRRDR
jgi:transcriptional regulator with GAF, ATPase, and Fis domain